MTRGLGVHRQAVDAGEAPAGEEAPEITPAEAERQVTEARDSAASEAGAAPAGDEGGGGPKKGPTGSETRRAAEERAGGGGDRAGEGEAAGPTATAGQEDSLAGLATDPPTDQSTIPNVAQLTGSNGHLAQYAEEEAWHDAWVAGGKATGMAVGDRAELVGEALGAGATEGLTGGLAAAVVGQLVKHGTKSLPYASGFMALGEMAIKGQSPVEWGKEQFGAGGKKVAEGWGKLWGGESDWIDRIEGFVDILDGLNNIIGTISTICFIVAAVLAVSGVILAVFGVGAALLGFAGLCAKAGLLLGKIATIVGIIVVALRLIVMAARAAQIMLSDADPAVQAKRADSLRKSTSEFAKETTKSFANRKFDQLADDAKARREATAKPPEQPDDAPAPAAAGPAQKQVGDTEQRQSVITKGLDALSAGEFSKEVAGARQTMQGGWGLTAGEQYLPDTLRQRLEGDRALQAGLAELQAEEAARGGGPTPPLAPEQAPDETAPAPVPIPVAGPSGPVAIAESEPPSIPPPHERLTPVPPAGPGDRPELRPLTAPLPLEAIPDNAPAPQGVQPGAIGHYDPLTSAPDYVPHPFALESQPPGAPGASRKGGRMPGGREDAEVFAEHATSAAIMGETVPGYEVHGPRGQRRKGHGTRHHPTISVEESTKSHKDALDSAALADIQARKARGEEVPWEEAVVGGNVRLRDAAAQGGSTAPGYQHTKSFLAEVDMVQGDPRHGFVEHRPGQPGPLPADTDIDAHLDAAFAPYTAPPDQGGPAGPPIVPSPIIPVGAAPIVPSPIIPVGEAPTTMPAPEVPTAPGTTTTPTATSGGARVPSGAPGVYGAQAPGTAPSPAAGTGQPERTDIVSQWERLRKMGEEGSASAITETLGFTGEGSAFASALANPAEAAEHRRKWVEQQREAMTKTHLSVTENLPPPPREKKAELDAAAKKYAELDVEERQVRFQQREIAGLKQSATEEMTAIQALQQLMAANRQAIAAEQKELDGRSQAQTRLREKTTSMGQQADQAGTKQQSQSAGLQSFLGKFTEMMGIVPSKVVSNSGQGTSAASQLGKGFEQGGKGTADAADRSQAASQHLDTLGSQTQECRSSFQESNTQLQALQQLAGTNLTNAKSGRAFLVQAGQQATQKLQEIADAKQNERNRQREAIQVMSSWAQQHYQLRTTGQATLEAQMCQVEEGIAAQGNGGRASAAVPGAAR